MGFRLTWDADPETEEQRVYRSIGTPIPANNLPSPVAVLAGAIREFTDPDTPVPFTRTYYRIGAVRERYGFEEAVSAESSEAVEWEPLFENGEGGGIYPPPNPDSYFADTSGTTPAALGGAVALVQGEVGPDWTQGTATARPVWAREPEGGRRNLLTWSEDFSDGAWTTARASIEANAAQAPDGTNTANNLVQNPGETNAGFVLTPISVTGRHTWSLYAKAGDLSFARIRTSSDGIDTWFDLSSGLVGFSHPSHDASIESVGGGWYRCSVSTDYEGNRFTLYPAESDGSTQITSGVASFIRLWGAQLETGSTPTPYQRVTTAADVTEAGVPDVPYVRFDLADDVLTTTLPAATYTVVLPTRQGIWIDSVTHAGGTFSIGPTSYTGGPAGILTALASDGVCKMIAPPLAIDRALSAGERNGLVRWYQSRGAGAVREYPGEDSLSLDFVGGEYIAKDWLDGTVSRFGLSNIMTTTRASGGGYFDHLGVYQWAANNEPRIDHDPATLSTSTTSATLAAGAVTLATTVTYQVGSYVRATYDANNWMSGRVTASTGSSVTLWVDRVVGSGTYASWTVIRVRGLLVEESRTRLNTAASNFESTPTTNLQANATGNTVMGFAETKLVPSTDVGEHTLNIYSHATNSIVSRNSVIVRAGEYRWLVMSIKGNWHYAADNFARFDLATGTVERQYSGVNAEITGLGEGLYCCEVSARNASAASSIFTVAVESDISSIGYDKTAGDGTSGLYIYHAQCEDGSFATSPIGGEAAQVTRAADVCEVSNLADWFNASEGTLYFKGNSRFFSRVGQTSVWLQQGGYDGFRLYRQTGTEIRAIWNTLDGQGDSSVIASANLGEIKHAATYSPSGISTSANGLTPEELEVSRTGFAPTSLSVGSYRSSYCFNGHIESIQFIPRALSNTELQAITT